jgi:hypothetical protein
MNNNKITLIILFIAILYLQGCKQKDAPIKTIGIEDKISKILPFEIDKKIYFNKFDSVFQKDRIIKLETNSKSFLVEPGKIEYFNNKIYIIDTFSDYSVTCFDTNGKFKFQLKNIGKGPGEYISFEDANINKCTGDIELLAEGRHLMLYDSLGNFKQKIQLPYYADNFCSVKGIRFFYKNFTIEHKNEIESFRLYSMDLEGTIKKYFKFKSNGYGLSLFEQGRFSRYNDNEYRFIEHYNDTVYRVSSKGIEALYKVNFIGYENNKPKDFLTNREKYPDQGKSAKEMSIPFLYSFYESDKFITGYYRKYVGDIPGIFYYIFDKEKNTLLQNQNNINYGLLNVSHYCFYPEFYINNHPISIISPTQISQFIITQANSDFKKKIKSFFEFDDNINNNPYIIQYKSLN